MDYSKVRSYLLVVLIRLLRLVIDVMAFQWNIGFVILYLVVSAEIFGMVPKIPSSKMLLIKKLDSYEDRKEQDYEPQGKDFLTIS